MKKRAHEPLASPLAPRSAVVADRAAGGAEEAGELVRRGAQRGGPASRRRERRAAVGHEVAHGAVASGELADDAAARDDGGREVAVLPAQLAAERAQLRDRRMQPVE